MIRVLLSVFLILQSFCLISYAFETSELESKTAEELLLFFEEEELVIATRYKTPVRKAPAIATVITAREIRNMGARNLMDVFNTVSSIGISIDEFGRDMFEVRGIRTNTSEKILVMIDGHRLNEVYTGSALANVYNDLPVENIKQVEIIRGPGSALYGANAFVAVINIITKDAADTDGIGVNAAGGSFNTKNINILSGGSYKGIVISGSADKRIRIFLNKYFPHIKKIGIACEPESLAFITSSVDPSGLEIYTSAYLKNM